MESAREPRGEDRGVGIGGLRERDEDARRIACREDRGKCPDGRLELRIGDATLALDDRRAFRMQGRGPEKQIDRVGRTAFDI